ncbi:MAG: hypothetical protein ABSG63_19925, partial [Spirochaetia bacterium]
MQGKRILDLYRDGALLGHRGASAVTAMKAGLSEGLAASLPSVWEGRLCAALARMFPGYPSVRIFSSRARALAALSLSEDPWDPALAGADAATAIAPAAAPSPRGTGVPVRPEGRTAAPNPRGTAALWRPFLPAPAGARVLLPVLPLTMCGAPAPALAAPDHSAALPESDHLPGFLLAGALHALAALSSSSPKRPAPRLGNPILEKAVDGARGWARTGPYVRAVFPAAQYPRVHAEFLRAGVLLCPTWPGPSILPGECSSGENRLLADLFAGHPGG